MTRSGGDLEFRYVSQAQGVRMYWDGTWDDSTRRVFHVIYDADDPTQTDRIRL